MDRYTINVFIKKEGKFFIAHAYEIELCSQGKTEKEAFSNLKEAFELWLRNAEPSELSLVSPIPKPVVIRQLAIPAIIPA